MFVDANLLIYSTYPASPFHIDARTAIDGLRRAGIDLWVSRQILREYLASTSRPPLASPGVVLAAPLANVRSFFVDFRIVEDGAQVTDELLQLLSQIPCGGKQVHDANIVATMLVHGVPTC